MRETGLNTHTSGGNGKKRTKKTSSSGIGRRSMVYVGKEQYPVSIIQIAQVLDVACKNKSVFDLLTSTVNSLSVSYNVSDLITLVCVEVPMDTYYDIHNL